MYTVVQQDIPYLIFFDRNTCLYTRFTFLKERVDTPIGLSNEEQFLLDHFAILSYPLY